MDECTCSAWTKSRGSSCFLKETVLFRYCHSSAVLIPSKTPSLGAFAASLVCLGSAHRSPTKMIYSVLLWGKVSRNSIRLFLSLVHAL